MPGDCETHVTPPNSKWTTLSEPLSSAITTLPSIGGDVAAVDRRRDVVRPDADDVGAVRDAPRRAADRQPDLADVDLVAALLGRRGVDRRVGKHPRADEVGGPPVDLGSAAELGHPAGVERGGVAAEEKRLGRLGRRIDDDAVPPGEEFGKLVAQFLAQLVVEIGERLVEQDDVGILDQRAGERGALLLAARQLRRPSLQHRRQAQERRRPA